MTNVEGARKELVAFLTNIPLKMRVVFDSPKEGGPDLPVRSKKGSLEILFAPRDLCADKYILEILSLTKKPKEVTLVTSDRPLCFYAKDHGVATLSIEEFLALVEKKQKKAQAKGKPTYNESDYEKEALRKIFVTRLKDN